MVQYLLDNYIGHCRYLIYLADVFEFQILESFDF